MPASRFRAAGATAGATTRAAGPPAATRSTAHAPQPLAEDVSALLDGVDFDGIEAEDEDEDSLEIVEPAPAPAPAAARKQPAGRGLGLGQAPQLPAQRPQRQGQRETERMVLDEPPQMTRAPQRQGQAPPAKEQRTVSTMSTASDVVIQEPSRPPPQQQQQQQHQAVATTSKAVVPAAAAPQKTYPWTKDVYKALRQRFGLRSFRANQEEAINATLSGRDVFVLLPTGGGKSLCFQLPAVVSSGKTRGVSIVVSPLLSLISDQTRGLIDKDIPVVFLNSTMPAADKKFALSCLRSDPPMACLAYVTPEQVRPVLRFRALLFPFEGDELTALWLSRAECRSSRARRSVTCSATCTAASSSRALSSTRRTA